MQKRYWMIPLSCLALWLTATRIGIHIIGSAIGDVVQARQPGPGRVLDAAPGSLVRVGKDTLSDRIQVAETHASDSLVFFLAILREHHALLRSAGAQSYAVVSPIADWHRPITFVVQYNRRMPMASPIGSLYLRERHDSTGTRGYRFPVFADSILAVQ